VQGRGGGFRRLLTPELVDQAVARDDLVRPHEQDGEQRTLMRAADPELAPISENFERAEDTEFEGVSCVVVRGAPLPRQAKQNDV